MKQPFYLDEDERKEFYRLMHMAREVSDGMERWMEKHLEKAFAQKEKEVMKAVARRKEGV